ILRKFLSADNLVSDPYNTQSYDRYSYVLNNPLLNVDLDGNEITLGVAVIIAVGVAIFGKAIANMIQGIPFWYGMGKAATMGAIAGAISFGIGSVATSAFGQLLTVGKAAFEAGMHAISSGLMSAADGGKFGSGFWIGLISSAMASGVQSLGINFGASTRDNVVYNSFSKDMMKATMIAVGGFSGGISSAIAGGSFWKGFQQGLITSGLNHVAHWGAAALQQGSSFKVYDDDGNYVGKMKVKSYRTVNYDDGSKATELDLRFTPADNSGYDSFQWVQTVFTNDSSLGTNQYNVFNDPLPGSKGHDSSPYYWNKSRQNEMYDSKTNTYRFYDAPNREVNSMFNIFWRAEVSLVGINSSGAHALSTMKWGFNYYQNNSYLMMPLQPVIYNGRYKWLK
ncbi:MAG: hypothetical protein J0I88_01790, partial [Chryseobacterium sp.]|nr:hypothetical protein [Chryseobacterium sp.]